LTLVSSPTNLSSTDPPGQTNVKPAGAEGSSFLERERALLGDDADQFASAHDHKATTVEEADEADLLGGGGYSGGAETLEFESSFPEIDANEVSPSNPLAQI
jgi:Clathrin light chain